MKIPKVTVLMPVFNGEEFLREAVASILEQTFSDFEYLVIDDASTDRSREILESYSDPRLRLLVNPTRLGLTKSLNEGLQIARGVYLARMDADDISRPTRLKIQNDFLDRNPEVGLLGSSWEHLNPAGQVQGFNPAFNGKPAVHFMCHGSIMIRKTCLLVVGPYREIFEYAQDYDLYLRISEKFGVANIPEPLYRLRLHPGSVSRRNRPRQDLYASLALKLAKERKQKGRNILDGLGPAEAARFRDQFLSTSGWSRDRLLSYNQSALAQAALDLGEARRAGGYIFKALRLYPFNLEAWNVRARLVFAKIRGGKFSPPVATPKDPFPPRE